MELIAHRGASLYAPENTLEACRLAHKMGARSVECDVQLTADHVPVILHDNYLNRTTNGSGKVREASYAEISSLDAGAWFSPQYVGARVPLLSDLLQWQKQTGIYLHLEIKGLAKRQLASGVACIMEQVHRFGRVDRIQILSFQVAVLAHLQAMGNTLPTALEIAYCRRHTIAVAQDLGCQHLNMSYRYLRWSRVQEVQRAGMQVGVFTINDQRALSRLQAVGVDRVFTDDLALLR